MMTRRHFTGIFLSLVSFALFACGGGALGGSTRRVDEVGILSDDMRIAEKVRVEVFFQTETEFGGDPKDVDLVVRISSALRYVVGSSEIYDNTTDDRDDRPPTRIVSCEDGATFLVYRLSSDDLEGRSLNGGTQYGIRFEVRGESRTRTAVVEASAGSGQEFSCRTDFSGEEADTVEVL